MATATEKLLKERGKTHGAYADHARITQKLKAIVADERRLRVTRKQTDLSAVQLETIDMILHKIGRVLAGNADTHDHWDDMAGYATLASKDIPQ